MTLFQRVDKLSVSLVEKKSELNELTVAHKTVRGQLEGKTAEMETLLQQNREVSFVNHKQAFAKVVVQVFSSEYFLFMVIVVNRLKGCF